MKFNINDYKGNYVMHCKTEEEARDFCNNLYSIGKNWCSGDSYYFTTQFHTYKDKTAYNFNAGSFSSIDFYKEEGFKILEWSDFMKKKFTKADLKNGDAIKRKNGNIEIVLKDLDILVSKTGWNNLKDIGTDLRDCSEEKWDIIEVRRSNGEKYNPFDAFECDFGRVVYKREEPIEMTLEEICAALGKEIKIVKEKK